MTNPTPTPTPEMMEASNNVVTGFADMSSLVGPLLLVAAAAVVVSFVVPLARDVTKYKWVYERVQTLKQSVYYAGWGIVALLSVSVVAAPLYVLSTADSGTQQAVGMWSFAALAGYVALVGLGYATEAIWERLATHHEEVTGERPFASWGEEASDE